MALFIYNRRTGKNEIILFNKSFNVLKLGKCMYAASFVISCINILLTRRVFYIVMSVVLFLFVIYCCCCNTNANNAVTQQQPQQREARINVAPAIQQQPLSPQEIEMEPKADEVLIVLSDRHFLNTTQSNNAKKQVSSGTKITKKKNILKKKKKKFDLNTDVDDNDIRDDFLCSISQEIMQDPVIASDGYTYDRKSIEEWLRNNEKSPMTLLKLESKNLIPNRSLKSAIESWKDEMKRKWEESSVREI